MKQGKIEEGTMKEILFKKKCNAGKGIKSLSISQQSEDKDSTTLVRKSFLYHVTKTQETNPKTDPPQIYIKKVFDTKKKTEKFFLKVKGAFYMTHKRLLLQVNFQHTLNIHILWKAKSFSIKNATVLG